MRSLLPLPPRGTRRGLGALAVSLLTLTTGCSWITGLPDVDRIGVTVNPDTVAVGLLAQATGAAYNNGNVVQNSRVVIGYKSSDPSIATVNPSTGQVTPVAPGVAVITATWRGKSGSDSIVVTPAPPAAIEITPVNLYQGTTVPLTITLRNLAGQVLPARAASITSTNPTVVTVEGNQRTDGTTLRGIAVGNATISVDVGGKVQALGVTVFPPLPTTVSIALPNSNNSLIEGQTAQAVVTQRRADNTVIPNPQGAPFLCSSDDPTVASVQAGNCLVQAVRPGTTTIRVLVGGSVPASFQLTVVQIPAWEVRFTNRNQFVRLASNGAGVVASRTAIAYDSVGRQIANRPIAYRSTDPTIVAVSTATGTVTPVKLGQAKLIASADNGKVADTLDITVTPVPIWSVVVRPEQPQLYPGQTQAFTATLTDSLGATITGRTINWFSTAPTIVQVNQSTGVASAIQPGTAQVSAQVEIVPGLPGNATVQPASVLVLPTKVGSIDVVPTPISVTVGRTTPFSLVVKDESGATIFTSRQIIATPEDPTIVTVNVPSGTGTGTMGGLKAGTTNVTFQALDHTGAPQGTPKTVTVNVAAP